MDHFGPAWGSFPATDRYDPTRLWLACVSLALRFGHVSDTEVSHVDPAPAVATIAVPAIADIAEGSSRSSSSPTSHQRI